MSVVCIALHTHQRGKRIRDAKKSPADTHLALNSLLTPADSTWPEKEPRP